MKKENGIIEGGWNPEVLLMTPEEYAELGEHAVPYIYELKIGDTKLTYFGFGHSNDPADPAYVELRKKFSETNPDLVLVEGFSNLERDRKAVMEELEKPENEPEETLIRKFGESWSIIFQAVHRGIEFDSPEPKYDEQIRYLEDQGFTKDQIFVFYVTRDIGQHHRTQEKPELLKYLEPRLIGFQRESWWGDFDYSFDHYQELCKEFFGRKIDLMDVPRLQELVDPTPHEGKEPEFTNRIAVASSKQRDVYMLEQIAAKVKKYKNIFIVYGASHAVMQEPALRSLADRNKA